MRPRSAAFRPVSIPALSTGLGIYTLGPPADDLIRVSSILDDFQQPATWSDGRTLICEHQRGNRTCGVKFNLLSNHHFEDETERLRSQNGILTGPTCEACGRAYLDAPGEFAFNGANAREGARHRGVRLIHKPCRGKKGSRFTVSVDHARQKDRSDNIRILSELVNNVAINGLRRVLAPAPGASEAGVARIYNRIFWLERVLLACKKAQLARRRARWVKEGRPRHTRIAHDDIVLTVNWETAKDTRVTSLNCAVSADIQSGYVFRLDVDVEPTARPFPRLACRSSTRLAVSTSRRSSRRRWRSGASSRTRLPPPSNAPPSRFTPKPFRPSTKRMKEPTSWR